MKRLCRFSARLSEILMLSNPDGVNTIPKSDHVWLLGINNKAPGVLEEPDISMDEE